MAEGGVLRELAAIFSIEVESEKLEAFDKKVEGLKGRIVAAGKLIVEALALHEVKEFFQAQIEGAAHLQNMATKLGVAAGDLNAFQFAAKSAGVDADTAAGAIGHLNKTIGAALIAPGGEQASLLAKLGLKPKDLTDAKGNIAPLGAVLGDVADKFAGLKTQPERAAYAFALFGKSGQAILPILAQGKEKLVELYAEEKELGDGLGDAFPAQAKEAEEAQFKFNYALQSLKNRITADVLPAFMKFYTWAKDLVVQIIAFDKRTHALHTILGLVAAMAGVRVYGALVKVVGVLFQGASAVKVFIGAFKLTGTLALLYALYYILDDISAWARGGQSMIGRALDAFGGAGASNKALENLKGTFDDISDAIDDMVDAYDDFSGAVDTNTPGIVKVINGVGIAVASVLRFLEATYHTLALIGNLLGDTATVAVGAARTAAPGDAAPQADSEGEALVATGIKGYGDDYNKAVQQLDQDFGGDAPPGGKQGRSRRHNAAAARVDQQAREAWNRAGVAPEDFSGPLPGRAGPKVAPGGAGAAGKVVTQNNKTTVTVNVAGSADKKTVGDITAGVKDEVAKANQRALDGTVSP